MNLQVPYSDELGKVLVCYFLWDRMRKRGQSLLNIFRFRQQQLDSHIIVYTALVDQSFLLPEFGAYQMI